MKEIERALKELVLAGTGIASAVKQDADELLQELAAKGGFAFGEQVPNEELHYRHEEKTEETPETKTQEGGEQA